GRAARGGALAGAEATTAMRPQIGPSRLSRTCRAFAAEVAVADSRATQQRTCHVLNHGTSIPPRRRVRDRAELPRGARQSDLFTLTLRSPSTYPIQGRFTHGSKLPAYYYATQTGWKSNSSRTRWSYRNGL